MSTKQNTPQYTILRLIEKTNRPFYELIDNLCIGRLFVPRVGVEVTFLIPDDKLTAILSKMESNVKTAEECVKIIQACVLMGYYTDPEDFRNGAISVVGGKVAPIPAKNLKIMKDFLPKEYQRLKFLTRIRLKIRIFYLRFHLCLSLQADLPYFMISAILPP
jgi:hypothetical protein